jgi:ABC-type antimicrobial peptide transport system permease subunit
MSKEKREVSFPISEAVSFAVESIRRRFTRAFITVISIILGIAFMVALLTIANIVRAINPEQAGLPAYQLWMAIIALLVCGVGIVNSMLMSVTERYKEIGTIKTLGAMDTHVLEIFIIEALLLGLIGGVIGGVAGWAVAFVMYYVQAGANAATVISASIGSLYLIAYAVGLSVFLSLISSVAPSYMAAKLNPAEALRYEV